MWRRNFNVVGDASWPKRVHDDYRPLDEPVHLILDICCRRSDSGNRAFTRVEWIPMARSCRPMGSTKMQRGHKSLH